MWCSGLSSGRCGDNSTWSGAAAGNHPDSGGGSGGMEAASDGPDFPAQQRTDRSTDTHTGRTHTATGRNITDRQRTHTVLNTCCARVLTMGLTPFDLPEGFFATPLTDAQTADAMEVGMLLVSFANCTVAVWHPRPVGFCEQSPIFVPLTVVNCSSRAVCSRSHGLDDCVGSV